MTENKDIKKSVLGLSSGTLGLSGGKNINVDFAAKLNKIRSAGTARSGSSVVVVKKNRFASQKKNDFAAGNLTNDEVHKRVQALQSAEKSKETYNPNVEDSNHLGVIKGVDESVENSNDIHSAQNTHLDAGEVNDGSITTQVIVQHSHYKAREDQHEILSHHPRKEEVSHSASRVEEQRRMPLSNAKRNEVRNLDRLYAPPPTLSATAVESTVTDQNNNALMLAAKKRSVKSTESEVEVRADTYLKKPITDSRRDNKNRVAISALESGEDGGYRRTRSLSSIKRARAKMYKKHHNIDNPQDKVIREVMIPDLISVQELSNRMAEKASKLIKSLMNLGTMVTVNQSIDADTAELLVTEFGHKVKRVTDEEFEKSYADDAIDKAESLEKRPPVVTIMGHVDHGKTSLLDALRSTDVVSKEAGGITQHIGAYMVRLGNNEAITFLDTPGHEAFTAMRMRGAKVTDIVVLVVAADDNIKEQTIEAINHAKAAGVAIIVAINKIDKPGANPEAVKQSLLIHSLIPEDMGGDIMVVNVSARDKLGLDKLEEAILLQADLLSLQTNYSRSAQGTVIESKIDKGRGIVATLLVQKGTLKVGEIVVAGSCYGKIKSLINDKRESLTSALPSTPVEVLGLNQVPTAGDEFMVVADERTAKELAEFRSHRDKEKRLVASRKMSLEQLFSKARQTGLSKDLAIIIKGDVHGSVEAISSSLMKLPNEELGLSLLHSGVGGITESDITLAAASNAIIIGFNVRANNQARDLAKVLNVDIKYYSIIYNLVDEVKAILSGMLSPTIKEKFLGYADIRQVFDLTKFGKVAGCYVTEGIILRTSHVRLLRDNVVIHEGKLKALKRFKEDIKEVKTGFECGMSFEKYEDMRVGDRIEAFEITEESRTL